MIVVFVEYDAGAATATSLEALTVARRLATSLGVAVHGVAIGEDAGVIAEGLGAHGVTILHTAQIDQDFAPAAWARAIVETIETLSPLAVLAAGSDRGNEVMAHVGAQIGAPMAANCVEVEPDEAFILTRQRWGGSLLEQARLSAPVKLLTIALHAVAAEPSPTASKVAIASFTPSLSDDDLRVRVIWRDPADTGKVALPHARVVIGGGRGVGSASGFSSLDELAGLLGGAVGVSRAVTSLGWRPHAEQIGQTGARIAPDLYVACGISGASQHIVGCRASKRILAINTDPEAPILAKADYAVIGDLHAVVPAVCAEIRRRRG